MTGYGRGEALLEGGKLTVEIRSVNGKNADIGIKTSFIPKDKEMAVRKKLSQRLQRGTIDLFISWEPNAGAAARPVNHALALAYYSQLESLAAQIGAPSPREADTNYLLSTLLRMPDVLDSSRQDVVTEEVWPKVEAAIDSAIVALEKYRIQEGKALEADVTSRVHNILALEDEVESYEAERITAARARIIKAADDLSLRLDPDRLEQEILFYLEKLDINEEKVRLRTHCKYFLDTVREDPFPGRKLGFIIQEMGREINTTGSKANHAAIQKAVVKMKDELEKIREQSLNIL